MGVAFGAGLGVTGGTTGVAFKGLPWLGTGVARGGGAPGEDEAGAASLRENSAVSLRYQISTPPPMTVTKVKKTSRMPRQDFMAGF